MIPFYAEQALDTPRRNPQADENVRIIVLAQSASNCQLFTGLAELEMTVLNSSIETRTLIPSVGPLPAE
jgi:hypothetical protein